MKRVFEQARGRSGLAVDWISARPATYLFFALCITALVGMLAFQARQAELTVVLSLFTLFGALRFSNRLVYLTTLTGHVAITYLLMVMLNSVELPALIAATVTILIYAEGTYRSVRSRVRIDAERQRHLRNLELLEQIRTSIARELDYAAIARLAVEAIARVIGYRRVAIYTVNAECLDLLRQVGWPSAPERLCDNDGMLARAVQSGSSQFEAAARQTDASGAGGAIGPALAVPIHDGEAVVAVIQVEAEGGDPRANLTPEDAPLLVSAAQEIGIAMSRARLHESVQRERDQHEQITRALGQALCVYDGDGNPTYINAAFERLLGWTLPELQKVTLVGLVPPPQIARLRAEFEGWRAGIFGSSEMTLLHRNGTLIPFMVTTSPRSLTGQPEGGVGVMTDLRDIKRSQEAQAASERRFRALYLEAERQRRVLEARDQVSTALALELAPGEIGRLAVDAIANSQGYSRVDIFAVEGDVLTIQRSARSPQTSERIPVSRGIIGRAVRTRQLQYVPDVRGDPDYVHADTRARSAIAAPVFDRDQVVAVLLIETSDDDTETVLGQIDIALVTAVAEQIGIAYGRARLYSEIERDRNLNAQIMRALGQGLLIVDRNARIEYMNPALEQLLGWTLNEANQATLDMLVAESDNAAAERAIQRAIAGERQALEISVKKRDGGMIPAFINTSPRALDGESLGAVAVFTDLSQIREAQRALQASETRFRQLYQDAERRRRELEALDKVRTAIARQISLGAVLESVLRFIHHDLRYDHAVISRLEADELVAMSSLGLQPAAPRSPLKSVSRLAIARKEGIIARDAHAVADPSLNPLLQSQICVPLIVGDSVFGVLDVLSDAPRELDDNDLRLLTMIGQNVSFAIARAQLIAELEAARDQALYASRAKSEFLTMMSHELRTPLNVILGSAELLLSSLGRPDQIELARMASEAGENLLDLVNDILDLARIEAGRVELNLGDHPIEPIARAVFRLLEAQAAAKGICLVDLAGEAGHVARCDAKRTRQVLFNLMGNAIKFTQAGSIELRIEAGDGRVKVSVADTGPGISREAMGRLFQPFSQVDSSTARRFGGTGLGLAISRQLIELMRGEIGVESEVGRGSTFWFTLPVSPNGDRIINSPP